MFKLTIFPDNKTISVPEDTGLLAAIIKAGIVINSSCAGQGTCGSCKVRIKSGKYEAASSIWISKDESRNGYVLACQAVITSDITIEISQASRVEEIQSAGEEIFSQTENLQQPKIQGIDFPFSPLASKIHLKIPKPNLQDNIPDFERINRELETIRGNKNIKMNLPLLRSLPGFIRHVDWGFTVTVADHDNEIEIIHFEEGDKSKNIYGIALDIGTTTVAASLIDLNGNKVLNSKVTYNRQISFGDDVISRIIFAEGEKGLEKLNHSICDTVNNLIHEFIRENNILRNDILAMQVSGNTTMIHLFLGIAPDYIRKEPYVPAVNFPPSDSAQELNIKINPRGIVSCVPGVAAYLGGDITAGVLACGMYKSDGISLLIDLGTNGEIALGNKDWFISASCSAGPAFEGVGIKSGMRAIEGAIQRIEISDNAVKYSTIGDKKPKGICGSGLIDIPGELLKKGLIDRAGKFVVNNNLPSAKRIRKNQDDEFEFVIVESAQSATGSDIVITESDIENLMRSKGAVFLGIQVLLQEMELGFADITRVYVSGGFGTYLDIEKAVLIGLLPDLPREKFVFAGNSSLRGAKLCLLSREAREKAKEIADTMTYIELSVNPKFMNEYTSTLFLPHTDINLFPSVRKILESKRDDR